MDIPKKKIAELLEKEEEFLKINEFTTLYRSQKRDILGNDLDLLEVSFKIRTSCDHTAKITSRDPYEIVEEIIRETDKAFEKVSYKLAGELRNGDLPKKK